MTNQLKTKLTGDKLYFLSFGLFLITSILSTSFYYQLFVGRPYMWLQILGVALLVCYEFMNGGFRDQDWKSMLVCVALFFITFRVSDRCCQV